MAISKDRSMSVVVVIMMMVVVVVLVVEEEEEEVEVVVVATTCRQVHNDQRQHPQLKPVISKTNI